MCPSVADISVGAETLADSPNLIESSHAFLTVSAENGASYIRFYNGPRIKKG